MRKAIGILVVFLAVSLGARGGDTPKAANPGFDKLKSLVGEWEGKTTNGKNVRVSYKLVSNGSSVMETLHPPDESEMVTMYHPDGTDLMLTHYCNANNQPRMRAKGVTAGAKEIHFSFVDVTNLASPQAGHMHKLTIGFAGKDAFTQQWTWREGGREQSEVFHFARIK